MQCTDNSVYPFTRIYLLGSSPSKLLVCVFFIWCLSHRLPAFIGEVKSAKAYAKWAKQVSETKPPTSPLKRRHKWVIFQALQNLNLLCCFNNFLFVLYWTQKKKMFCRSKNSEDLYAIISQRQNERKGKINSMLSSLMSKYGGDAPASEPSEEEFEAARRKLESKKKSKGK